MPTKKKYSHSRAKIITQKRRIRRQKRMSGGSGLLPYIYNSIYNVFHGIQPPPSIEPWIY